MRNKLMPSLVNVSDHVTSDFMLKDRSDLTDANNEIDLVVRHDWNSTQPYIFNGNKLHYLRFS